MTINNTKLLIVLPMLASELWAQAPLPNGSIIAVRLNSALNSRKTKPGQVISARVMQDVPTSRLHERSTVLGRVLSVKRATTSEPAELSFRFDSVRSSKRSVGVNTDLRALASMMDVEDAQVPPTGPDRGTPWTWSTRNLIGGEVAYGQGGPVERGTQSVGHALASGILVKVEPNSAGGCRGEAAQGPQLQALWVFFSDACGAYGFPGLTITHSGRSPPLGQITVSSKQDINIRTGSGMLLRVNSHE